MKPPGLPGCQAEDQPYVIRTERLPNGRESASTPGQTTYTEKEGVREYGKYIGATTRLKRAYADALRPEQERTARPVLADRDELAAKLEAARNDLARFEQTPAYQRAQAFDQLTKREALERHPGWTGPTSSFTTSSRAGHLRPVKTSGKPATSMRVPSCPSSFIGAASRREVSPWMNRGA
jgi:hypothetical protein